MDINDISKAPEATKTAEAANREQVTKADDGIRAGSSAEKKDTFRYPFICARRRRDSNPRAPEGKRISSAPRYDHFDTSANISTIINRKSNQSQPQDGAVQSVGQGTYLCPKIMSTKIKANQSFSKQNLSK